MDDEGLPPSSLATTIPSSPPLDPRYPLNRASSPTSSEPPLFSSDGPLDAEDLTNYESPRVKRKRAGPWWEQELGGHLCKKKKKTTKLSRNFDSGVFMMSDGSFGSDSSIDLQTCFTPPASEETPRERMMRIQRETAGMRQELAAMYSRVQVLVEQGKSSYDLSSANIQDSDLRHLVRPIDTIIQAPPGADLDVPVEGQYRSMVPKIVVNLRNNQLSKLEPTLFDLQYLTSLNLSNNHIEELPPQIAKLTNLETLGLFANKLRWLPCEILSLLAPTGKLQPVTLSRNPGYKSQFDDTLKTLTIENVPTDDLDLKVTRGHREPGVDLMYHSLLHREPPLLPNRKYTKMLVWLIRMFEIRFDEHENPTHHRHCPSVPITSYRGGNDFRVRFMGATPPSYFDAGGHLLPNSPDASKAEPIITISGGSWPVPKKWFFPPSKTKVHSLTNLTMCTALFDESPAEIRKMLQASGNPVPPSVEMLIRRAEANYERLADCHVCGEPYLVPAAEWIEVWSQPTNNILVKVKVCSWGCVPDEIAMPPERELDLDGMEGEEIVEE
ncbi:hypothetical protein K458DRAFT_417708 [Lentithecium fluviatile CBS 122367]|uniref:L domain-like protein n=1 Tax=Lentithecium fluviatile CBS 122367 TaxID=1168545 RepID=A0A6G1J2U4_9PLEO|nr:hypothetical protein K458DRAFT_417708 [Lentithecium fluviatile CBS 122367]